MKTAKIISLPSKIRVRRWQADQFEFPFVMELSIKCELTDHITTAHIPLTRDEALEVQAELQEALSLPKVVDSVHSP